MAETVTLQIPERLYQRLVNTADATKRPLEEVMLHALQIGSPPEWDDVPEEFQSDLAALDRLDDNTLWQIARSRKTEADRIRFSATTTEFARGLNITMPLLRFGKSGLLLFRFILALVPLRGIGSCNPSI